MEIDYTFEWYISARFRAQIRRFHKFTEPKNWGNKHLYSARKQKARGLEVVSTTESDDSDITYLILVFVLEQMSLTQGFAL